MLNCNSEWTVVGCFGRPHGIKGFITVHSFTEPRDNLISYSDWHIKVHQKMQRVNPLDVTLRDKCIIVRVENYLTREDVAALTNQNILISSSQLPSLPVGEYYWSQLIGLKVINQHNQCLGVVEEILPTGSNDVLVTRNNDKRHLIPYIQEDFVISVDLKAQEIHVLWDADF